MRSRTLRRLASLLATVLLAWPGPAGPPVGPAEPSCPPGSEIGMDDFIVWVDGAGGSNADVPVRANLSCSATRTITYKTFDLTARAGEDYVGVNSGTVVLTGGTTSTTIQIRILGKTAAAPDETFGIRLLSGATFSDAEAIVTIKSRY